VRTLVSQRITGIALGHEDLNDHDELRRDPLLALLSGKLEGRRKGCAPLAGKSTLSRLEHAPAGGRPNRYRRICHDPEKFQDVLAELFIDSWQGPAAGAAGAGHRLDRRSGSRPPGGPVLPRILWLLWIRREGLEAVPYSLASMRRAPVVKLSYWLSR